jgi:hypothetical protein
VSNVLLEQAEKNGMCIRPLRDLPADYEDRFEPTSFVPRDFLLRLKHWPGILQPPPDVAGYESNGIYRRAVTWDMVMERRRKRQAARFEEIEENYDSEEIKRVPMYVWVFWCPGVGGFAFSGFAFKGWWLYLIGRNYSNGKYMGFELTKKIMDLFPLVEANLFGPPDEEKWKREFVKQFPRGLWCGKPQGKALVWAEVSRYGIEKLERTEWVHDRGDLANVDDAARHAARERKEELAEDEEYYE